MTGTNLLKPDRRFVDAVIASGGGDLKKCFQCATCSVSCGLSVGRTAFPRKEMGWAQWGLKDRLMADPDIWRCHQCNDCSSRCPRSARPGDVLAAIRWQAVEHYSFPRPFASWVNRFGTFPLTLLIPVALLALALLARDPIAGALGLEGGEAFYARFFPHWLLIGFFSTFASLAALAVAVGGVRFWKAMKAGDTLASPDKLGLLPSTLRVLRSIVLHDRFRECDARASRRWTHLLAFYGFIALFGTTVWAVFDLYLNPLLFGIASAYPYGPAHPVKFLANAGAILLVTGAGKAIWERARKEEGYEKSTSFDWIFVSLIFGIGVTGLLIEVLRYIAESGARAGIEGMAYSIYFMHLVLVFGLLVYLPYSKFAHIVYRTVAMVYAEYSGRSREICSLVACEAGEAGGERSRNGSEPGPSGAPATP